MLWVALEGRCTGYRLVLQRLRPGDAEQSLQADARLATRRHPSAPDHQDAIPLRVRFFSSEGMRMDRDQRQAEPMPKKPTANLKSDQPADDQSL